MGDDKILTEVEKKLRAQKLYDEIMEKIQHEQPFAEELKKYSASGKQQFYEHLAKEKQYAVQWGNMYYGIKQAAESWWLDEAFERLKEIQQKKLFDIQCLWHAEQYTLPQIQLSVHFYKYGKNIFNCPFIEPVTAAEVDLYIAYVNSKNFQFDFNFNNWQNFEEIRSAFNGDNDEDGKVPEWYRFYNSHTGKNSYMSLPDIRGEKERFYKQLAEEHDKSNIPEPLESTSPELSSEPEKPFLSAFDPGVIDYFVANFEDKETQNTYKKYKLMSRAVDQREYDYRAMVQTLASHGEIWPIDDHNNWRLAFNNCYNNYRKYKIAEALPLAYEQYKMYREMNIPFEEKEHNSQLVEKLEEIDTSQVLMGRKINNEPEDLNF